MSEITLQIITYVGIAIIIFILIREVVTWYWKINQIVDSLDRIDSNLQYIATLLKEANPEVSKKMEYFDEEELE